MQKPKSAGLLMYKIINGQPEFLLAHPGGPFWANKDETSWFIPKGEINPNEDELSAAQREFHEETSFIPKEPFIDLGEIKKKSGKIIRVWAFEGNCDPELLKSNLFSMEWPPKSGKMQEFPEMDKAKFFSLEEAKTKMNQSEFEFAQRLMAKLGKN